MEEPPPFQEAAHCVVCRAAFTTFKRRHHCRACGRSFCNEHSANQKALPQYALYAPVRVCDSCYNPPKLAAPSVQGSRQAVQAARTRLAKLDLEEEEGDGLSKEDGKGEVPAKDSFACTCGMPLCICETSSVSAPVSHTLAPPKPRATAAAATTRKIPNSDPLTSRIPVGSSYGNTMPSLFFSSGNGGQGSNRPGGRSYDLTGEGIREAVKNGDVSAVRQLLSQGVDVNYIDKQGMSLLHVAAMFNFTEIAFVLMDSGANVNAENGQGEKPIDCAQTTLAFKMRKRIESNSQARDASAFPSSQ